MGGSLHASMLLSAAVSFFMLLMSSEISAVSVTPVCVGGLIMLELS